MSFDFWLNDGFKCSKIGILREPFKTWPLLSTHALSPFGCKLFFYLICRNARNMCWYIEKKSVINSSKTCLLYKGFFSSRVIFVLFHLQTDSPRDEFAKAKLWLKKDNLRYLNSPSLKFSHWQQERNGQKNTRGRIFPCYSN